VTRNENRGRDENHALTAFALSGIIAVPLFIRYENAKGLAFPVPQRRLSSFPRILLFLSFFLWRESSTWAQVQMTYDQLRKGEK
jgi:hypothetical protein